MTTLFRISATAALFLVCVVPAALAQTSSPTITGRVLAADSDTPLRRARVVVTSGGVSWRPDVALTDNDGRFTVDVQGASGIANPFSVTVTKGGYTNAVARVERKDAQSPLLVRLVRGAAISGVAIDRDGVPVAAMTVTANRLGGQETGAPPQYLTTTDDRGEYRLGGLSAGRYEVWAGAVVTILVEGPKTLASMHQIHTGEKTTLTLEAAGEIGGVQLLVPDANNAEAAGRLLRESGRVPSDARITVEIGRTGELLPTSRSATGRVAPPAIRGRVLTTARRPVQGATVRINRAGVDRSARTDATGSFSFDALAPGQYAIQALATEQMEWQSSRRADGQAGRQITVAADQVVEGVELVLPPTLAISGFVVDEHGEAVEGARVQALQLRYTGGRLTPVPIGNARTTDDRGRYRIGGLQPGSYLISALVDGLVAGSKGTAYAKTYFPGTPTLSAAFPIDLRDDATANLAFAPLGLADVRVVARDGDSTLAAGTARLAENRRSGLVWEPRVVNAEKDGSFLFRNVPSGAYVVQVRGDGPGRTGLYGTQELVVGFDPMTVTLSTSYGANVEGRIVVEGDGEAPYGGLRIVARDDHAREPAPNVVRTGGEYFVTNLFGLTSLALLSDPGDDWYLKSWTINGIDVVDTGYDFGARPDTFEGSDIVISRNGASISGRVEGDAKPVDDYGVIVFPVSREMRVPYSRRMKFHRSTLDGTFRVAGLPPGDYLVAAVSRILGTHDGGDWQNPDLLLQLESRAERVRLLDGERATVTLRLVER